MKFELDTYNRNTPDQDLLDDLIRVAKEIGKDKVTIDEYNERGKFHSTTLTRRFGNWFKSLEKAGLEKTRNLNIPDEELFENIETVWLRLGRQPRYQEMTKPLSKFSSGTYEKRYGTWRQALERFVEFINSEEIETEKSLMTKAEVTPKHKTKRDINWRLRFLVMRKDNFKCVACGRNPATDPEIILHVDHILAWDKGGETVYENLQTLCSVCNIGKSNLDFKADENGSH
ncbi:homing endonuclease associated repeat-containing protein [Bergeyella sp. RCAD1439]|uniref:homing endonuclease associated repeat-containing protein n=1 Tax=Bergeyella anatis TaxID=3113737 RepID=UPI002E17B99B|nr:HNH endonuclease [Bergeyella sp. RCAD1439]